MHSTRKWRVRTPSVEMNDSLHIICACAGMEGLMLEHAGSGALQFSVMHRCSTLWVLPKLKVRCRGRGLHRALDEEVEGELALQYMRVSASSAQVMMPVHVLREGTCVEEGASNAFDDEVEGWPSLEMHEAADAHAFAASRAGGAEEGVCTAHSTRKWRVRTPMQVDRKPRQKMEWL